MYLKSSMNMILPGDFYLIDAGEILEELHEHDTARGFLPD
jgi:hypothetical protein